MNYFQQKLTNKPTLIDLYEIFTQIIDRTKVKITLFKGFAQQRGRSKSATTSKSAIGIVENAFEILGNVVDYKENIAISPLSIVGGMYMLAAGSAGDSRQQVYFAPFKFLSEFAFQVIYINIFNIRFWML